MADNEAETVKLTVRVTPAMNAKLLGLANRLRHIDGFQGGMATSVTKAMVIRECLAMGAEALSKLPEDKNAAS